MDQDVGAARDVGELGAVAVSPENTATPSGVSNLKAELSVTADAARGRR